jgi:glycosyltransferase involved in cell wall biosynthesis
MIEDGVTGLLVDIGDASEMAKKIIHLLEHQDLASTLANNARRASEMYTWRYVRNLLLPILQGKQMDRMRILQ